jgi:diguanylate cyclase (GGDEF)-like protein/PAS domain S-box-containing protein
MISRIPPVFRLAFSLAMITLSLLFLSQSLGFAPSGIDRELEARQVIAEALAVQLSNQIGSERLDDATGVLQSVVERNERVKSVAVKDVTGSALIAFGPHAALWSLKSTERSTPTQVQVPIFYEGRPWGALQIVFVDLAGGWGGMVFGRTFLLLAAVVVVGGFIAYSIFLSNALRELNPASVIPERVERALDTLAEGLLIIDDRERIVFSNGAFAEKIGLSAQSLIGTPASSLGWLAPDRASTGPKLPWVTLLEGGELESGVEIELRTELNESYKFVVNASPIAGAGNTVRGVLATFDDVTELEQKNEELQQMLQRLEDTEKEIMRQNRELRILATHDPLTDCLNRRSFFSSLQTLFESASEDNQPLSCIMVDLDNFKAVNDKFGHAKGDEVIQMLAATLKSVSGSTDLVARYGGEEFVVITPGKTRAQALELAEAIRTSVYREASPGEDGPKVISASLGVAGMEDGPGNPNDLVDLADQSLYAAKHAGRNCVMSLGRDNSAAVVPERCNDEPLMHQLGKPASVDTVAAPVPAETPRRQSNVTALQVHEKARRAEATDTLPGRTLLLDRIGQAVERALRDDEHVAVVVVSIGAVRRITDTLGYAVGEKTLRAIASRLQATMRRADTVALVQDDPLMFGISRFGTDEFAVVMSDLKETQLIDRVLRRVVQALEEPLSVEGREFYLDPAIGVSVAPGDSRDAEMLLRCANSAMRSARRQSGRGNYRHYSEKMHREAERRMQIEQELHRALDKEELITYYQPKVDLASGEVSGMEALLRWRHPELGFVPPDQFIDVAEQIGLIGVMGDYVFDRACRQIRFWSDAGLGDVPIAVNVSPVQFIDDQLASRILATASRHGVSPALLELEVTESMVMQNLNAAVRTMEALSAEGVRIAVDDFGTGYAAINCLRNFPLDTLKIDRSFLSSFVSSPHDAAIVSAIVALGQSIGLTIVAEGVETLEQLQYLHDLHCDQVQGYLIAKPMSSEDATRFLRERDRLRQKVRAWVAAPGTVISASRFGPAPEMVGLLNQQLGRSA